VSTPRPLNDEEKSVAWAILSGAEVEELDALRAQLDAAVAVNPCECGCPSIGISVDRERARPTSYSGRPVAETPWEYGAIMVWIDDGCLSNLEIYGWDETPPEDWPDPSAFETFERYP
jgi:hypothetical protein